MPKGVIKSSVYPMRFEADELALLKALSKELGIRSLAALIRLYIRIGLGTPTREQATMHKFDDIKRQLRGMANNLNQMTRAANAGKFRLNKRTEDQLEEMKVLVQSASDLLNTYQDASQIRSLVRSQAYFEARRKNLAERSKAKGVS